MKVAKWITLLTGFLAALGLSGCRKPHMLDGPGMVYEPPWTAFTISRSDGFSQYNFWFTVSEDGEQCLLTGECCDAEGNFYDEEIGIALSAEDLWKLRWMDLELLSEEEEWPDNLELPLDMHEISLSVTLSDGTVVKKNASSELSIEIYQLLLPYLKNNQK